MHRSQIITLARNTQRRFVRKRKSHSEQRRRVDSNGADLAGSLDQGFANNGVVARGPFFRWRFDTHRIYILLLLLGKRSSAERLFNTTRSLARPPGYFTIVGPARESGGALPSPRSDKRPSSSHRQCCSTRRQKLKHDPGRDSG